MPHDLQGKRILVTREAKQARVFSEKIIVAGGVPIEVPLLKIACKQAENSNQILEKLPGYHWIIFTSANGVHCFFKQLPDGMEALPEQIKIAVVGHKTEEALLNYYRSADLMPEVYDADSLADIFLKKYEAGESILLVRGNRSRDVLPKVFTAKGIGFDSIEVYETTINKQNGDKLQKILSEHDLDFITFTSPSTVQSFVKLSGKHDTSCVCIGTTTEKVAIEHGFSSILTAEEFTIEGMIKVMSDYIAMEGNGQIDNK